jgi:hypothetical protein
VDTQNLQLQQNVQRETEAALTMLAKKSQELEIACSTAFSAHLGRIMNLEAGLTNSITESARKIAGVGHKMAEFHSCQSQKGPVAMDIDPPPPVMRANSCPPLQGHRPNQQ